MTCNAITGEFTISGLRAGRYSLTATAPGGLATRINVSAGDDQVEIRLGGTGALTGAIRLPDGSAPTEGRLSAVQVTVQRDSNSGTDVVLAQWPDYTFLFVFESTEDIMPECREMAHLFAGGRPDRFEIGNCSNRIRVLGADDDQNKHADRARTVHRVLVGLTDGVVFDPREPGFME